MTVGLMTVGLIPFAREKIVKGTDLFWGKIDLSPLPTEMTHETIDVL